MSVESQLKKPTLVILGARGFLGGFLVRAALDRFKVLRADRTAGPESDLAVDITSPSAIRSAFRSARPDAAILLAAMSDIDRCQHDPDRAHQVNLLGSIHVAEACLEHGTKLLFTSTGAVFDGTRPQYDEQSPVSPISVYGVTKARAEEAILRILPMSVVVRASLILGRSLRPNTNSLIESLFRKWNLGETVAAPENEWRNPIDASQLATWMLRLLERETNGIYHAGCSDLVSRAEIATRIAVKSGVDPTLVRANDSLSPLRAPRGAKQFLISNKIGNACGTPVPSSDEVILRSLHEFA